MKIFIAGDHNATNTIDVVINYFKDSFDIVKLGDNYDGDDYPDFAFKLCNEVLSNKESFGVLICGNGIGMSIAANKVKGIRAARITNIDDAIKCKMHNGVNVLCMGSNLSNDLIISMINTYINTSSPNEERHIRRINKIIRYENGEYNEL